MVTITSDFDSGNIEVLDVVDASNINLEIKPDGAADFFQWFFFRVDGANRRPLTMRLKNAQRASYVDGWKNYQAVASYDQENWFRVETSFDGRALTINHCPKAETVYYAYFAPYPTSRYRAKIEQLETTGRMAHEIVGKTIDGQDIDLFRVGNGGLQFWVIARQHPGETMGSWWVEGFLERLNDPENEAAASLCKKATLNIVPCMNLDGAKRGHLRTNAAGTDLNRAWRNASMEKSPEVYVVRERMRATGVDFFLDVHGDEVIPNNFLDSAQGIPSWNDRHEKLFNRYSAGLLDISEEFQTKDGYPASAPGEANLDIANSYVAETWGCLSMTLEMPFKDAAVNPDPVHGWSPERCRKFAGEHLAVMAEIADQLR